MSNSSSSIALRKDSAAGTLYLRNVSWALEFHFLRSYLSRSFNLSKPFELSASDKKLISSEPSGVARSLLLADAFCALFFASRNS